MFSRRLPMTRDRAFRLLGSGLCLILLAAPLAAQWTPEETMKVKAVGVPQVSPDGKRAVYPVTSAVMTEDKSEFLTHLWMAAADGSGSFQFTFGEKSAGNPAWSPCGRWIAFTSGRSGKSNIWIIRADGGEAEPLTDVKTGVGNFAWSPDGKSIAFVMADPASDQEEKDRKARNDARVVGENEKKNHLWVVPVARDESGRREPRRLTQGEFTVSGWDWSPDGATIAFARVPSLRVNDHYRSDITIVDAGTAEMKPFAATAASESGPLYSPDGRWIAYNISDIPPSWAGASRVAIAPAAEGPARVLAPTFDEQPDVVGWSADGKGLYYTETERTITRLGFLPADGGAPVPLNPGTDHVLSASLNRDGTVFGLSIQDWDSPSEAFVTPVGRWAPVPLSRANADAPGHPFGRTEVIRWKGPDGLEIEGLLTYPVGYEKGRRYPLLVVVHGGPSGGFSRSCIAARGAYPVAAFAAEGWAVLRGNIRGSSGYGKAFRLANYRDWGGKDYRDLMAGVDRTVAMGVADPGRLGVMGWSYGGCMTSWVITQTKRFKAASVGAGVTDLMSFSGTTDIPDFILSYFGAEFWQDPEVFRKHSAMFNIKGATTPTLIQHGEQDIRVPVSQGYELYSALKRQGTPVKMVVYPRQPHAIGEPQLIIDAGKRNIEWFRQYLGEAKQPSRLELP
jgi:dipeptidyl aminopeptidase/acylaminoacyl peptidase